MKKRNFSSDNRRVPGIRRNKIGHCSLRTHKQGKLTKTYHNSDTKTFSLQNDFSAHKSKTSEDIKREEEILQSPLVKSIKKWKLLFEESLNVDDHYYDDLE